MTAPKDGMHVNMNGVRRALLASALMSVTAASAASAAPAWLPPVDLSAPAPLTTLPEVGVDNSGNATTVWAGPDTEGHPLIRAAVRPAGQGGWALPAVAISPADSDLPQIAVNASGAAVAAWLRISGTDFVVEARRRAGANAAWGPVTEIAAPGPVDAPDVAIDAAGNALITFHRNDGTNMRAEARYWPAAAAPEAPATLSDTSGPLEDAANTHAAFDGAGNAVAVWQQLDTAGNLIVRTKTRPVATGTWSAVADDVSPTGEDGTSPQVGMNAAGTATVVWEAAGAVVRVNARTRIGGTWGAVVPLSSSDADAFGPEVGVDGSGRSIAIWSKSTTEIGMGTIEGAVRSAGLAGSWTAAGGVSSAGRLPDPPALAVNPAGAAMAVWSRPDAVTLVQRIQSAALPAGSGTWSSASDRSNPATDATSPAVAIDGSANAVGVWTTLDAGNNTTVQAARFDATKPVISTVNVPGSAAAGQLLQMSVVGNDLWSPLSAPTWNFGDGTGGAGDVVHHAYSTGGTFTVTVTETDAVGNSVTDQRQVTVSTPVIPLTMSRVAGRCVKRPGKRCLPKITLSLNQPAKLRLIVRRSNGKLLGVVTRTGRTGKNSLILPAKVGKTRIGKGAYRISVQARSATGTVRKATVKITVR